LWVAKQIVERHDGTIEFRPREMPGRSGAKFIVKLPSGQACRPPARQLVRA
jgi:signal transduction histidine kinase